MTRYSYADGYYTNADGDEKYYEILDNTGGQVEKELKSSLIPSIEQELEATADTNIRVELNTDIFFKEDSTISLPIYDADTNIDGGYIYLKGYAEVRYVYIDEDNYLGAPKITQQEAIDEIYNDNRETANDENETVLVRYDIYAIPDDLASKIYPGDTKEQYPDLALYDEVSGGMAAVHPHTTCKNGNHDWHETGRRSNGGGVIICYVCKECNLRQTYNSWATHHDGSQGHVRYSYDDSEVQ